MKKGHPLVMPMHFFSKTPFSYSGGTDKSNFFGSLCCPSYSSSSFWKKVWALFLSSPKVYMEGSFILRQGSSLLAFLKTPTKASFLSYAYHNNIVHYCCTRGTYIQTGINCSVLASYFMSLVKKNTGSSRESNT